MIPIKKNIIVINENENLLESTYIRRAKQLVKKGRAKWLNENTIKITLCSPNYKEDIIMPDNNKIEFNNIDLIKGLIEKITEESIVATKAIEELSKIQNEDLKGAKIVEVTQSHNQTKSVILSELVKHLAE